MAFDLEEQEQLDEFKAWWDKNGKMVTGLIVAIVLAYAGWQGYQYWMQTQATEASNAYQALVTTDTKNVAEVKAQADKLTKDYKSTPYAGRAAVFAAKAQYAASDIASAKTQLEWAIANAKESSVQAIAGLQLAGILYESKDYTGATKVLNAIQDTGYAGLKHNMLGDVLLAQGKTAEAKTAYDTALKSLDPQGKFFQLTKQKYEALGA
ncbi:MAG TPA: tetratricopeptide repeat protein [Methylophilus sp.]